MQELAPTSPRVGLVLQYLQERPTPHLRGEIVHNMKSTALHCKYRNCTSLSSFTHNYLLISCFLFLATHHPSSYLPPTFFILFLLLLSHCSFLWEVFSNKRRITLQLLYCTTQSNIHEIIKVKVNVLVYSLISMLGSMFSRLFTPWHGAATRAHPAHVDPTLDSCTRYPSLLGGQRKCRMRSLPKAPAHDQCRELNPRPLDLQSSALPIGPRDASLRCDEVSHYPRSATYVLLRS